jgi:hypothetical protein
MLNPPIDANLADVQSLFVRRTQEVLRYFDFLTAVTNNKADSLGVLQPDHSIKKVENFALSRDLVKTFRANGYLLLYNLVESTMTNAIDAIHQIFQSKNLGFDDLRDEIQQVVLKNFRGVAWDEYMAFDKSHPIQIAMLRMGYKKENLFSGNVDARSIRDTAKIYGFDIAAHDTSISKDGQRLLDIKNKRNQLAHGKISFEDCGHETSHDELIAIANETIVYLKAVLAGIEEYVTQGAYLASLRNAS